MRTAAYVLAASVLPFAGCAARPEPLPSLPQLPPVLDVSLHDLELLPIDLAGLPIESIAPPPSSLDGFPAGIYERDFEMEMHYHPRVQSFIDLFTGRFRERFSMWLARRGRYEDMIVAALRERGLPGELLYLPLVESGYSPEAVSRARAVGLWQFMAATARIEGLDVSGAVDERRLPLRATEAAVQHLERLYRRYGSWYLALAAYNAGAGRIDRALQRYGLSAPLSDSAFWTIRPVLPAETRDYVPIFIAASVISRFPDRFGFGDVEPHEPDRFEVITVPDEVELAVLAREVGVPVADLRRLNPHLLAGITPRRRETTVLVPEGHGPAFRLAFESISPEKRVTVREHTVARGETLSGIAQRYGTSAAVLQQANGITQPRALRVGQRLRIPAPGAAPASAVAATSTTGAAPAGGGPATAAPARTTPATHLHTVRRGENAWSIARRYGVRLDDLLAWNDLRRDSVLRPGDRLRVRRPS
jgi:membrane-bound lytic murein transglycosylase D